jgi:hypothetical protein
VNTVDDDEQDEEEYLLHCFEFADNEDDWFEVVKILGQAVVFKLDSNVQCNVLTKRVVDVLGGTISITATKRLVTYNGGKTAVVGGTRLRCVVKNECIIPRLDGKTT